ncbi:FRG domain-containing protein [Bradyrhizobium sp. 45]|uniref:FRG domain-containing protein n=1 Tax=Bradyrhizobium sp. 45 TaxID=1043587 RepID=UPI001FFA3A9A|nr:FRG domain-containing protein [Bradyrhizobium sp. 45]MCK1307650.1 FRG domain-containing protein [Bradyrhizobium sp. 45]
MSSANSPFRRVQSAEEFDRAIVDAKAKISAVRSGAWFRGQRVGAWSLTPGLFRRGNDSGREHALFEEFRIKSGLILPEKSTSWRMLYLMQHFGVPTRLLDWTETLHVALYFALHGELDKPRLWLLNPYILTAITTKGSMNPGYATRKEKFIHDLTDDPDLDYYTRFLEFRDWPFALPLPIYCKRDFTRIDRQNGYFTIHGSLAFGHDERLSRCLQAIQIEGPAIDQLKQRLKDNSIDAFAIFNDLAGLAQSLKDKYKLT